MSNQTLNLDRDLYEYLLAVSLREPPVLARLREETAKLENRNMQIAPEQGQFMRLLVRLTGARRMIEVGTFTGYSALSLALALPEDGRLICCDVSEEWTAVGQRYWQEAGIADKIDLRIGSAVQTLDALLKSEPKPFDLIFIDADKESYDDYYERSLRLLRPGGLVLLDNTLWNGSVAREDDQEETTLAIRALNSKLAGDERVDISLLPIGDGLTLARKREQA
jgi:caffeoyl-CoA O-methyltransferase